MSELIKVIYFLLFSAIFAEKTHITIETNPAPAQTWKISDMGTITYTPSTLFINNKTIPLRDIQKIVFEDRSTAVIQKNYSDITKTLIKISSAGILFKFNGKVSLKLEIYTYDGKKVGNTSHPIVKGHYNAVWKELMRDSQYNSGMYILRYSVNRKWDSQLIFITVN